MGELGKDWFSCHVLYVVLLFPGGFAEPRCPWRVAATPAWGRLLLCHCRAVRGEGGPPGIREEAAVRCVLCCCYCCCCCCLGGDARARRAISPTPVPPRTPVANLSPIVVFRTTSLELWPLCAQVVGC